MVRPLSLVERFPPFSGRSPSLSMGIATEEREVLRVALLWLNGDDLRSLPLLIRRQKLKHMVPTHSP